MKHPAKKQDVKIEIDLEDEGFENFVKCAFRSLNETLLNLNERIDIMSAELDALTAQVDVNTAAIDKVIALVQGSTPEDKAKLTELTAKLKASDDALAAVTP